MVATATWSTIAPFADLARTPVDYVASMDPYTSLWRSYVPANRADVEPSRLVWGFTWDRMPRDTQLAMWAWMETSGHNEGVAGAAGWRTPLVPPHPGNDLDYYEAFRRYYPGRGRGKISSPLCRCRSPPVSKEARALARIVVVGSVAQDDVVTLLQPLDPGRHLDATARALRMGGGGANTAIPLSHAGHHVSLLAPVGADAVADWLLGMLSAAGIDVSTIARVPGDSTRSLVLVEPGGERTIVNIHRCRETGPPRPLASREHDVVYVRSRDLDLRELLADAVARSLVVAHVPPLAPGSRPAHVLVGSESDLPPAFLADPWGKGREVAGPTLRLVVITRGPRGAEGFSDTGQFSVPAPVVGAVVDTTAAGDVFAAGLVHALALGRPTRAALETAAAWGAAAVACPGVPSREAIQALL